MDEVTEMALQLVPTRLVVGMRVEVFHRLQSVTDDFPIPIRCPCNWPPRLDPMLWPLQPPGDLNGIDERLEERL